MTSLTKNQQPPTKKNFFRVQTRRRAEFWGFEQPSNAIGGGAMALARQPKTTGFRLKSRYDIFVERLSKQVQKANFKVERSPMTLHT